MLKKREELIERSQKAKHIDCETYSLLNRGESSEEEPKRSIPNNKISKRELFNLSNLGLTNETLKSLTIW